MFLGGRRGGGDAASLAHCTAGPPVASCEVGVLVPFCSFRSTFSLQAHRRVLSPPRPRRFPSRCSVSAVTFRSRRTPPACWCVVWFHNSTVGTAKAGSRGCRAAKAGRGGVGKGQQEEKGGREGRADARGVAEGKERCAVTFGRGTTSRVPFSKQPRDRPAAGMRRGILAAALGSMVFVGATRSSWTDGLA